MTRIINKYIKIIMIVKKKNIKMGKLKKKMEKMNKKLILFQIYKNYNRNKNKICQNWFNNNMM